MAALADRLEDEPRSHGIVSLSSISTAAAAPASIVRDPRAGVASAGAHAVMTWRDTVRAK